MSTEFGLTLDAYSWPLYLGMVAFWIWSVRLVPERTRLGWRAIPMSLFGLAWIGFAPGFIVRFLFLSWDSFTFGNMSPRLADATSDQVDTALLLSALYFACVVVAYRLTRSVMPRQSRVFVEPPAEHSYQAQALLALLSTVGIVLSSGRVPVPQALLTPLGILGSFWVVPATYAWWERFREGGRASTALCWALLLPGILRGILSPYREHFMVIFFVIIIAALFAGRRIRLVALAAAVVGLFFIATVVVSSYRQFLWEDYTVQEAVESSETGYTLQASYDAKWVQALNRFHGFDSVLLTVRNVPDIFPFSWRNLFVDSLVRGFVPRILYQDKEGSVRGMEFAATIWGLGDQAIESLAAIAPSMPGDLYEAGGVTMVVLGALVWGLMVGLLEAWKARLSPKTAAAFIALFALHVASSSERDFAHMMSTTIQYLIVMFLLSRLFAGRRTQPAAEEIPRRSA